MHIPKRLTPETTPTITPVGTPTKDTPIPMSMSAPINVAKLDEEDAKQQEIEKQKEAEKALVKPVSPPPVPGKIL